MKIVVAIAKYANFPRPLTVSVIYPAIADPIRAEEKVIKIFCKEMGTIFANRLIAQTRVIKDNIPVGIIHKVGCSSSNTVFKGWATSLTNIRLDVFGFCCNFYILYVNSTIIHKQFLTSNEEQIKAFMIHNYQK